MSTCTTLPRLSCIHLFLVSFFFLVSPSSAFASIQIAGEKLEPVADLTEFPKQLRFLRGYGPPDVTMAGKPTPHREEYLAKVAALRAKKTLTPDEQASLGGYLLYLKQTSPRQPPFEEAVSVLEPAARSNPRHYALAANLGTAYQLSGKLDAAERSLQNAVDLAPAPLREMEQLHLRLVQRRLRENLGRGAQPDLDLLFGRPAAPFRFIDAKGQWNYGEVAASELDKLPGKSIDAATRQIEQLLVWLPDDGRLHWQLAEFALASKQHKLALDLFRESVDTFRLSHPSLKQHRSALQEAMHWQSLNERLGKDRPAAAWVTQVLGQNLASLAHVDVTAPALIQVAAAMPARKSATDLFNDPGVPLGNLPAQPEKPFVIEPWHWILIALGIILGILMLYWQLREWLTRLRPS